MAINNNRPTSPHLQVYKLPLTGIISITHRMTGVMLSARIDLFCLHRFSACRRRGSLYRNAEYHGSMAGASDLLGIYLRAVFPFMSWCSSFDLGCRKEF